MTDSLAAEQIKNHNIKMMGQQLGEVYTELWQEVTWLNLKWQEYVELFGSKQSRIDIMNNSASEFFYILEKSMWESVFLHITRLTDPPSIRKKKNLSIQLLLELVKDQSIILNLKQKIEEAKSKSSFARDWRNRLYAHIDYELAIGRTVEPLKLATREKVKNAIKAINEVMNEVSMRLLDSETGYENILLAGGATSLLYVIREGLKAMESKREKLESGELDATRIRNEEI